MSVRTPTSLRLALREIRRHLSTPMGAITIIALVLIPTIYGGLYLYANHDPYAALNRVPAALVVTDTGATGADGERLEAGNEVAEELLDSGDFDWHRVDPAQARAGVADGTYDFALVIGEDFSSALSSSAGRDPRQATLRMVTNDANSYLSTTIANTVTSKVRDAIAERVSAEATTQFLLGIADVRAGMQEAEEGAEELHDGLAEARDGGTDLADGARQLRDGSVQLRDGSDTLASGLGDLEQAVRSLPKKARKLADGADQVADGNARIAATGEKAAQIVHDVRTGHEANRADLVAAMTAQGLDAQAQSVVLRAFDRLGDRLIAADTRVGGVSGDLSRLARGARQVADGNRALADATPDLVAGVDRAHSGANELSRGAGRLATGSADLAAGARQLRTGLGTLTTGAGHLRDGLRDGVAQVPRTDSELRQRIADTVADPVDVRDISQAEARSYGDGLAPFFLSLATWIGAYVLFIVLRTRISGRDGEKVHGWRAALAGWLPAALLGAAQASLVVLVVAFGVGIAPVNLLATWLFLVLLAVVFVAIVHAFTLALGQPGQFLALVLMVLQLVTAGGTFPWQTIPTPLHWLHHVLPMSYAVDGLRLIMYGAPSMRLAGDIAVLLAWGGVALVVSLVVGSRRGPAADPVEEDPDAIVA